MPKYLIKSSAPRGHRRAGLWVTPEGTEADVSKGQLAELQADPRIVLAEAKPAKADPKGGSEAK
jgi:hypothetical protein